MCLGGRNISCKLLCCLPRWSWQMSQALFRRCLRFLADRRIVPRLPDFYVLCARRVLRRARSLQRLPWQRRLRERSGRVCGARVYGAERQAARGPMWPVKPNGRVRQPTWEDGLAYAFQNSVNKKCSELPPSGESRTCRRRVVCAGRAAIERSLEGCCAPGARQILIRNEFRKASVLSKSLAGGRCRASFCAGRVDSAETWVIALA